jgi:hypothetical protein
VQLESSRWAGEGCINYAGRKPTTRRYESTTSFLDAAGRPVFNSTCTWQRQKTQVAAQLHAQGQSLSHPCLSQSESQVQCRGQYSASCSKLNIMSLTQPALVLTPTWVGIWSTSCCTSGFAALPVAHTHTPYGSLLPSLKTTSRRVTCAMRCRYNQWWAGKADEVEQQRRCIGNNSLSQHSHSLLLPHLSDPHTCPHFNTWSHMQEERRDRQCSDVEGTDAICAHAKRRCILRPNLSRTVAASTLLSMAMPNQLCNSGSLCGCHWVLRCSASSILLKCGSLELSTLFKHLISSHTWPPTCVLQVLKRPGSQAGVKLGEDGLSALQGRQAGWHNSSSTCHQPTGSCGMFASGMEHTQSHRCHQQGRPCCGHPAVQQQAITAGHLTCTSVTLTYFIRAGYFLRRSILRKSDSVPANSTPAPKHDNQTMQELMIAPEVGEHRETQNQMASYTIAEASRWRKCSVRSSVCKLSSRASMSITAIPHPSTHTCGPSPHHHKGQQAPPVLVTAARQGCQLKALPNAVA